MSALDNVALDLSRLSFDTPDTCLLTTPSNTTTGSRPASTSIVSPSIRITQEKKTPRSRERNRQCVPSDDEDDEEDEEDEDSDDDDVVNKRTTVVRKPGIQDKKKSQPLPSDDEEDDSDDGDDSPVVPTMPYRRLAGVGSTSNLHQQVPTTHQGPQGMMMAGRRSPAPHEKRHSDGLVTPGANAAAGGGASASAAAAHSGASVSHPAAATGQTAGTGETPEDEMPVMLTPPEGSHLHHLQQMQQYQQSQLAHFQQLNPSFLRPQTPQQSAHQQRVSMSGMDLLKQLEQEKADMKRQKPKVNPSHVKIEKGLLANVPEPGSHSISFQAMQKQQQQQQQQYHHMMQQQQQYQQQRYHPMYYQQPNPNYYSQFMYPQAQMQAMPQLQQPQQQVQQQQQSYGYPYGMMQASSSMSDLSRPGSSLGQNTNENARRRSGNNNHHHHHHHQQQPHHA